MKKIVGAVNSVSFSCRTILADRVSITAKADLEYRIVSKPVLGSAKTLLCCLFSWVAP